ncbi:MAG: CHAT domain-containing protein [Alphaproteobacteria bacterium]
MNRLVAVALIASLGFGSQANAKTSVQEILSSLDQRITQIEKADTAKADRELIATPIPDDVQGSQRVDLLLKKSLAAWRLNDYAKREELLNQALEVGGQSGTDMANVFWQLAYTHANGGDMVQAAKYRSMAADALSPSLYGRNILWHSRAAASCAFVGDFSCAQRHYDKAKLILNGQRGTQLYSTYQNFWWGYVHRAEAFILQFQGKNDEADKAFLKAIEAMKEVLPLAKYDKSVGDVPEMLASIVSERATNLSLMNNPVEAETLAIQALWESLNRSQEGITAIIYRTRVLASVLMEQRRYLDTKELTSRLLQIYERAGYPENSSDVTEAVARLARVSIADGNWAEARKLFDRIEGNWATESVAILRTEINADPTVAMVHLKTGDRPGARQIAKKAAETLSERLGPKHYETALARSVQALTLEEEQARTVFAETIPILLSPSRQSNDDTTGRASQDLLRKLVLEEYLQTASPDGAFRVAEALRARSVQSSIALSTIRSEVSSELATLIRQEQDAEKQIATLNGLLLNAVSGKDAKVAEELRIRIDKLRDQRGDLASRLEKQFPSYAEMLRPKAISMEEIQALLRPDEAMVAVYLGTERSFVWAVPKSGAPNFAAVPLSAKQVADQVAALRSALDPNVSRVSDLPAFDVGGAYRLYQAILGPVEAGWKDARNLVVVTNGALGYFPFGLFPTQTGMPAKANEIFAEYRKVPWLARTHTVTMVPSMSAFKALRTLKPANRPRPFAGFGDPAFQVVGKTEASVQAPIVVADSTPVSGDYPLLLRSVSTSGNLLPPLPDTREEILSIAKVLNADTSRDVFLGTDASLAKVKATPLSDYRVVEFATHGLTAGELGLAQPALALSGGEFLTVNDILQLKLNADWVVLSACNTAAAGEQGAEAISGLGSAFFYSGAKSLLVTNWPVQSASAAKLTTELFRLQADQPSITRAEALRQAMLQILDTGTETDAAGKMLFTYAHPLFWAPFSLVGDGNN